MKLRRLPSLLLALFLLPALLSGCEDDPSGPTDQIYTLQSVQLSGQTRTVPAELFRGLVNCGAPTPCNIVYQLRRGTLALRANGRYSFSAEYRVTETNNLFQPFAEGVFEDGTYQIRTNTVTFSSTEGNFLDVTGTLQGETLAVGVTDPIFEEREMYTFGR